MTDAEKLAEELLPCRGLHSCQYYLDRTQTHDKSCPAYYRPAVAAKLTEKLVSANRAIQALLRLAVVPERHQDDEWYAEYQKIVDEWRDDV